METSRAFSEEVALARAGKGLAFLAADQSGAEKNARCEEPDRANKVTANCGWYWGTAPVTYLA